MYCVCVLPLQLSNFSLEEISQKFGCALSLRDSPADTLAILVLECKQRSQTAVDRPIYPSGS